jgi:hypothetical protein
MGEIVTLTEKRALTLIRFNGTTRYCSESELLSDINFKLLRSIGKFDLQRGSAFSFLSCLIQNSLHSSVTKARSAVQRHVELNEVAAEKLVTNSDRRNRDAIDDLTARIRRSVCSTISNPRELDVQRWYVDSFLHAEFDLRRHECADAAMQVYGVSHSRSRELYDLTMLECRRVMYRDLPPRQPIAAGRLVGTRAQWMLQYAHLLTTDEFTKFVTLMRDLSPFVLLLVDPANRSRRQDRSPAVTRRNLEFALNGHPDAVALFK